jgi:hypothetical protein
MYCILASCCIPLTLNIIHCCIDGQENKYSEDINVMGKKKHLKFIGIPDGNL